MPRKTKKTSTAKPEATNNEASVCTILKRLCVVAVIGFAGCIAFDLLCPEVPKYGTCYQHRESARIVARVTDVGFDRGKYTEVVYSYVERGLSQDTETLGNQRSSETFNSVYKKLDDCDMYRLSVQRIRIRELEEQIAQLEAKLKSHHKK